jgi:hypothetical protein
LFSKISLAWKIESKGFTVAGRLVIQFATIMGTCPPCVLSTVSGSTGARRRREKLERLQALMRRDLTSVIEAAVTETLARLEITRTNP